MSRLSALNGQAYEICRREKIEMSRRSRVLRSGFDGGESEKSPARHRCASTVCLNGTLTYMNTRRRDCN